MKKENKWNGKLHIISDERFMALLTDREYQVFIGLKTIARHDSNGQSRLYNSQVFNMSELADTLQIAGRTKGSYMKRTEVARHFKSLISKGVLIKNDCFYELDGEKFGGYELINENKMNYKFAKVNNDLLNAMKLVFKGNIIKLYVYLKANFDNNKKNGNETFFKRETLAKAINEVSRKGVVGERQKDNITLMLRVLYTMKLVDVEVIIIRQEDGSYSSKLKIKNVTDILENYEIKE